MDAQFPTNPDEFGGDERISFSKLDNRFIAVHDDGTEFEFDAARKQWLPAEEAHMEAPLEAHEYGGETSVPGPPEGARGTRTKRKPDAENGSEDTESSRPARPSKKPKPPPKPKQNTAVYVTGLPPDATVAEIDDLFSRKGGLIAEEIDSGAPRIKLYRDELGHFKGDALVVFFKPESVRMAMMLLDDTDFRYAADGKGQGRMRVQEADSSYKKVQYDAAGNGDSGGNGGSTERQQGEPRRPKTDRDRQKVIKKTQKLDAKLADWSDDDDDRFPALAEAEAKRPKKVILRQMFRIIELEEDPASVLEIKEDIREECSKLGTVTSVVLYDQEPEGVVTVKFAEAGAAAACVEAMNGRPFDCRVVEASLATGKEKFKKTDDTRNNEEDSD